ncbi:unnamed protein product, partial [Adineta ricciae]
VLLKHITTRWLSLLRSIERLLDQYEPVKLFFLNEGTSTKVQQLLNSFFSNDESQCTLYFLQNVLFEIQKAELQLQRSYTTAVDLYSIVTKLIDKLQQKLCDKYYGHNTQLLLDRLKETNEIKTEELIKSFDAFVQSVIDYIKSYFDDHSELYKKLSFFNVQSFQFLTWRNVQDVVNLIHVNDLDRDQLYSEFNDIKCLYNDLNKKSIKLNDQIKSYILNQRMNSFTSKINDYIVVCDEDDAENNEETISSPNNREENLIRSDHLWAYLLNINPSGTPNLKKVICYIFSIPC